MPRKIIFLAIVVSIFEVAYAQPLRIAILDFDNISGIAKYDGLGKALSSMLISDIETNVSTKRLQLVERAQINKIMKEQNLQKSASFDKNTSVKMGKLLGVNFLLIGDIYILDNNLVINARLTDASTGDIKFSEKQEGKINEWLSVKTKLGKGVSVSLSMPFTEPRIPDEIVSPAVLTTYAGAIEEKDRGNFEKAETLIQTAKEFNPDFKYLDDVKDEIEKLKKQIAELQKEVEVIVDDPITASEKFMDQKDYTKALKYLEIGNRSIDRFNYGLKYSYFFLLSKVYFETRQFKIAIQYADSLLEMNQFEPSAIIIKSRSLLAIGKGTEALKLIENLIETDFYKRNDENYFKTFHKFYSTNKDKYLTGLLFQQPIGRYDFKIDRPNHSLNYDEFRKSMLLEYSQMTIQSFISNGREFYQMPSNLLNILLVYANLMEEMNYPPDSISYYIYRLNIKSSDKNQLFSNHTCEELNCNKHGGYGYFFWNGLHVMQMYLSASYDVYAGNSNKTFIYTDKRFVSGSDTISSKQKIGTCLYLYGEIYNNLSLLDTDLYKLMTITMGHQWLLSPEGFERAAQAYSNSFLNKGFSEYFFEKKKMSREEKIISDWEILIKKKLINRSSIVEFNKKYKIVDGFQ